MRLNGGLTMECSITVRSRHQRASNRPTWRLRWLVSWVLLIAVLPGVTNEAAAQQDIMALPKNAKPLDWDWYNRGETRELTFNRFPGISPDYRLGVNDELQIQIVGFEGPFNFRVRAGGEIAMPQVGNVSVAGLTAEQAEETIAARYREEKLLLNPEVLVFINSYEAKKFWVYGQIDRPGEYAMSQQLTVMDAILMAGGLDFYGSNEGYLHRRLPGMQGTLRPEGLLASPSTPRPGHTVEKLDLAPMRHGGLLTPNPLIEQGDVLVIPTRYPTLFYVLGDVVKPGYFQINTGERITVSRAMSQAGGPSKTAKTSRGVVVRYDSDGIRQELRVDYKAILEGRQRDFEIQSGDIVFVPGNGAKNVGLGLIGQLPQIVQTTPAAR